MTYMLVIRDWKKIESAKISLKLRDYFAQFNEELAPVEERYRIGTLNAAEYAAGYTSALIDKVLSKVGADLYASDPENKDILKKIST